MTRNLHARRSLVFALGAVCAMAILSVTLMPTSADALPPGCPWDSHTEIDYFDNPQKSGTPVGWAVYTCTFCNIYGGGTQTPYYTIIAETPCPNW